MARGSGINWDLRKVYPYEIYDNLKFKVPVGSKGDSYERYLCRMEEMRESLSIISQVIAQLPLGPIKANNQKIISLNREQIKTSMEATIQSFKL
jgi:NADH:ubiquinone oxidoreductase subunit D